jgi:hypothetical protein
MSPFHVDLSVGRTEAPDPASRESTGDAGTPAVFAQPCRLTMKLIQIGAKGEVQPFDTG